MSKKISFLLGLFVFLLVGCLERQQTEQAKDQASLKYAELLSITQQGTLTLVEIRNPDTRKVEGKYALYKDKAETIPTGYKAIQVPVKNIGAFSTTYIGMLDAIGATGCIKATTELNYVSNKAVRAAIAKGTVLTAGYENGISPESFLKHNISLIVYSGFGQAYPNEAKLNQLGITCMANYDWEEKHPLGKAEWILLFGALTDKWEQAQSYFDAVVKSYGELKAVCQGGEKHVKALVGGMNGNTWYAPAGESFMAGMLRDAGIDYCYAQTKGSASISLTLEQVFKDQIGNPVWINAEGGSLNALLKSNPKYAYFDAVQHGEVYSYFHDANYFWELSAVNPHWLLEDYMKINGYFPAKKFHFYRKLN